MDKLTHLDGKGRAKMVDVGSKEATARQAIARGTVRFNTAAFRALSDSQLAKGDAIAVARIAGIQAAKRTSEWIPLCHPIALTQVVIDIDLDASRRAAIVTATTKCVGPTGVEMEAIVAVQAACATLYDMAKALDRAIVIEEVLLLSKSGGRSGDYQREDGNPRG